ERVVDPDELVAAALRGRTLDPARPGGDARLAVEPREGRAGHVRERARARVAQDAEAVVARAVVDGEAHVDASRPRVERDLGAHRAAHGRRRAREAIGAQPLGQVERVLDGDRRAVPHGRPPPDALRAGRPDRRTGIGVGVFVAAVAVVDEDVVRARAPAGGEIGHVERAIRRDLHAERLVLDDAVAARTHARALRADRRGRAEAGAPDGGRHAVEIDDGHARPGQVAPDQLPRALAEHATLERRGERLTIGPHAREPGRHVDVVDVVDGAATDRVVRMVLEQRAPQAADLVARRTAGKRVQRLAPLEQQPLAYGVLLLDPHARRV